MVSEESLLKPLAKPKDPSLINSDDWPTFYLKKVKVLSQATGEPVSLLSAHKNNPVKVIGQLLEVDDGLQDHVRDTRYKMFMIELTDVTLYAFAEYVDGSYGFWAAGKAGWFEFDSVAATYKSIHAEMSEAASCIYVLADRMKKQKSKPAANMDGSELEKYMQAIFADFLSKAGNPARFSDVADVRQTFHEHRIFLITSMLECQEGLYWLDTPVFTYFKNRFPEEVAALTARIIPTPGGLALELKGPAMEAPKASRTASTHTEDSIHKTRKGRPPKEMEPSRPKTPPRQSLPDPPVPDDDDTDIVTTRKRKSFLRPPGAKTAKKARTATSSVIAPPTLDEDDSSDDEKAESSNPSGRQTINTAVTAVRNGEHLDQLTNPSNKSDYRNRASPPRFLPLKYLELSVAEYDIPSTKPQGPGGLWTCPFEDCRARVHQAGSDSGQERVKEHLKTHIVEDRVGLVMDESKPYLPVNNLVRHLQALAPPSGEDLPPDSIGRTFSAPIRRIY